jgi:hypothetical protein
VNELDEWMTTVVTRLGIEPVDVHPVLDLARDVAHGVLRPAAPLTAYLVGVAVGRGTPLQDALAQVTALIETWAQRPAS